MPPKKAAPKKAAPKKVAPKKSAAAEKEPSPKSAGKKAPAESKSKKAAKAAEQAVAQPPSPPAAAVKGKKAPGKTPLETAAAAPAPPAKQAKAEGPRRAPVDREVPNRGNFKVVEGYDVLLNQTNVGSNNNKFYIIQVLQDDKGNYYAWNRWGRIPEPGQNKLDPCGPNLAAAVKSFESKFREKTQCAWANRANFKKVDGKYGIVEKEDPADDGNGESGDASAPMGKLSRSQIEKGQAVLERLHAAISAGAKPGSAEIERLSSEFFTLIPTNFGRQRPVPITTLDQVNQKDALLKFYLRMGFEEVEDKTVKQSPIAGVMQLPLPSTLLEAVGAACPSASVKQAVDKGAALVPKKAGDPIRPVDKELYGAILLYTSNAIYRQLNQALREEKISAVKKYHSYLRMLFHAADSFKQKSAKLWRGVSVDLSKQYKVGDVITWWSVSSCTSEMSVAKGFAGGCASDSTVLTIDTKTACDISAVTYYSNEKESILLPGTKLLVKSVSKTGKVAEIHMEEVGRAVD